MYYPTHFKAENMDEAYDLMAQYPFATIITVVDGSPLISHLPLTPKKSGARIELVGHLAKANPHSRFLTIHPATVVFQGAHTYITPKWYAENDVPTWNYSIVHVTGRVELIESVEGIVNCLKDLTSHIENQWASGWNFFVPDEYAEENLKKNIVGFSIHVDKIEFKKKLSQNRSAADRACVLRGLELRKDDNSREILAEMLKLYFPSGEPK